MRLDDVAVEVVFVRVTEKHIDGRRRLQEGLDRCRWSVLGYDVLPFDDDRSGSTAKDVESKMGAATVSVAMVVSRTTVTLSMAAAAVLAGRRGTTCLTA
jgi:hypothetical protein